MKEQKYSSIYTGNEFFLKDHVVNGERVMPGVVFLEMARIAGEVFIDDKISVVTDVRWHAPLSVRQEPVKVQTILSASERELTYEVYSVQGKHKCLHSSGKLIHTDLKAKPKLNIESLKAGLTNKISGEACYRKFHSGGINYGQTFAGIQNLYYTTNEALSFIRIPRDEQYPYTLGLLDGALQTCVGFALNGDATLELPVRIDRVEYHAPFPDEVWCYVQKDGQSYHITLTDISGKILLSMEGFMSLPLNKGFSKQQVERKPEQPDFLYVPGWKLETTSEAENVVQDATHFIVSSSPQLHLATSLKQLLEEHGGNVKIVNPSQLSEEPVANIYLMDAFSVLESNAIGTADFAERKVWQVVKTLLHTFSANKPLSLTAFTLRNQNVNGTKAINPYGAGVPGLLGSLLRERPQWKVRVIDIETENPEPVLLAKLLQVPFSDKNVLVAIRNGMCYRRELQPVELNTESATKFKSEGVYVILGGAGGIGRVTSKYLIDRYNAKIVWLGRSEENDRIRQNINHLDREGNRPYYLQCNATDQQSVDAVAAQIRTKFGKVNGVFHSALVLNDKLLTNMTEEDFFVSFDVKAKATDYLVSAFSSFLPDFFCFYSSVQSQINGAGQANYSAGCTYQDTYAHYASEKNRVPVYVINWGYWGETGVVADDKYRKKMEQMGIGSIREKEGMKALEQILAGPFEQVAAIRLSSMAITESGLVSQEYRLLPVPENSEIKIPSLNTVHFAEDTEAKALLNRYSVARIGKVLIQLGFNEGSSKQQLLSDLKVVKRSERLLDELLRILCEASYLKKDAGRFYFGDGIEEEDTDLFTDSRHDGNLHIRLLKRCLDYLPQIIQGEKNGTDAMFPDGSLEWVAGIYKGNRQADYFNDLIASQVKACVADVLEKIPAEQKLRILEVGAGTGGTSENLFKVLTPFRDRLEYVYTDLSKSFLIHAEQHYKSLAPYLSTALLDIERDPLGQGFAPGTFDMVIGANVIHATRNIEHTLWNIKSLLKKNGLLVMNEIATNELFNTLTFGLLDGWWLYDDAYCRIPGSPGLSSASWKDTLRSVGFINTRTLPQENRLSQQIILSSADGYYRKGLHKKEVSDTAAPGQPKVKRKALAEGKPDRLKILQFVKEIVAEVLKMKPEQIDTETPITDYGIDSILGLNVIKKINDHIGTSIATTVLFDYPTVQQLTEFLTKEYGQAFADVFAQNKEGVAKVQEEEDESNTVKQTLSKQAKLLHEKGNVKPGTGKKLWVTSPGSIEDIQVLSFEPEVPESDEVLVEVKSFSLNFGDLLSIKGLYPTIPPFPFTPGFEAAGVIRAVGDNVQHAREGDDVIVMGDYYLGMHTSHITVKEHRLLKKPSAMSFSEACSLPVVTATMVEAFRRVKPVKGESILIQTATGGTGLITVQLANYFGLRIIATVGHESKREYLHGMGVTEVINYLEEDFEQVVKELTDGKGVDIVINTLSGDNLQKGINCLSARGRYVELSMTAIKSATRLDMSHFSDNQTFIGLDLRKLLSQDPAYASDLWEECLDLIERGVLKSTIGHTYAFSDFKEAYRSLEKRSNIGKIVVEVEHERSAVETDKKGNQNRALDIAIIGMSGQFGSASDLETYWEAIQNGKSLIEEVPSDRWDWKEHYDPEPQRKGKTYCKRGSFLRDIDRFDPSFFRITGIEAENMDPQQRIFLQHCWKAIEDAAVSEKELNTSRCGVYVGAVQGDYLQAGDFQELEPSSFWGNSSSVLASRISYFLNLKGPAIAVDTACSSSLVAIDMACKSLRSGETDMALSGGISVFITPQFYKQSSYAGMLSKDGNCYAFDSRANGFVPGEGVGVLVLKRLEDAMRNGDPVYGVIKGASTNQDGTTSGITAPSMVSQKQLEMAVYERYNIQPETIGLVEAHGTGTSLGDPIEFQALKESFTAYTNKKQYCCLGSVKANIGHTVMAAGVAGVIKVLLAMKHKVLPPSATFREANPMIRLEESPFKILTKAEAWEAQGRRRAVVSSFGFSGTNAHIVLEEYVPREIRTPALSTKQVFPFSARNKERLTEQLKVFRNFLNTSLLPSWNGMAYTLQMGRKAMEERIAFVVLSPEELRQQIDGYIKDGQSAAFTGNIKKTKTQEQSAAVFTKDADQPEHLAAIWVTGAEVNWETLWSGKAPCRVNLPGYQFAKERYWLKTATVDRGRLNKHNLHPLLHSNVSDLSSQKFECLFNGTEPFFEDHKVRGEKVLPGVACIEMARQAGELSVNQKITRMENFYWLSPLKPSGQLTKVHIHIQPTEANGLHFGLFSENGNEYACADLHTGDLKTHAKVNIEHIKQRLPYHTTPESFYDWFRSKAIDYGKSFQGVTQVYYSETEALTKITLPDDENFVLPPGTMDAALQTCAALSFTGPENALRLPYSIKKIELFAALKGSVWCHAERAAADETPETCHLKLYDEAGNVLVAIHEFMTLPLSPLAGNANVQDKQEAPANGILYAPVWERAEAMNSVPLQTEAGNILLLSEDHQLADAFLEVISKKGAARIYRNEITANSGITDVWMFPVADHAGSETTPELKVFAWLKAMLDSELKNRELRITVFTQMNYKVLPSDQVSAYGAGIAGLIGSFSREQLNWKLRQMDVSNDFKEWDLIPFLPLNEEDTLTCIRDGRFYKRSIYPLSLSKQESGIKQDGTYVILGGAGGIGQVTTKYLMQHYGAQVIWLGRSAHTPDIEHRINELEGYGKAPVYISCDATKRAEVENAWREIKAMGCSVNGIFHSAIVLNDKRFEEMSESDFLKSFLPKSLASRNLVEVFVAEPLDFICFYSSLQSHVSMPGQSNYASGCTYKDGYAWQLREALGIPVSTINWGYWGDVGIVADEVNKQRMERLGVGSITPEMGMEALEVALSNNLPQLITIKMNG